MVLNHVAQHAGFLVVGAAAFQADGFSHGDLDGVDVASVPDGFENDVGEAQDKDVLNGLFSEIVVDSVDLRFVEDVVGDVVESLGSGEVAAERLLDDDAGGAGAAAKAGFAQQADDLREEAGLGGQVENSVAAGAVAGLDFGQFALELFVARVRAEVAADVVEALLEGAPQFRCRACRCGEKRVVASCWRAR